MDHMVDSSILGSNRYLGAHAAPERYPFRHVTRSLSSPLSTTPAGLFVPSVVSRYRGPDTVRRPVQYSCVLARARNPNLLWRDRDVADPSVAIKQTVKGVPCSR